jgi:hypothetical protein
MQINHLASVRFVGGDKVVKDLCDEIDEKVDAYASGDLKHAAGAISLLWEASKKSRQSIPASRSVGGFGGFQSNSAAGAPQSISGFGAPQITTTLVRFALLLPFYR